MLNFNPGPSQLYFTVEQHLKKGFREGVPSLSHRSKLFEKIYQHATENLKALLSIPPGFEIFFLSSATEIWERSIQNLVEHSCTHLVNGAFSKRFYETALQLKRDAAMIKAEDGYGFNDNIVIKKDTELIAITQNETSTGVSLPIEFIDKLSRNNKETLIVVDAVSSLPYPQFNYSKIDSLFFSVQKGFGLPAGLGVWLVNEKCLAKAQQLLSKGISTGSYHNLDSLHNYSRRNQTPETPNVLAIYLLACITSDMLARGIVNIRRETDYKATLLYQLLNRHALMNAFVKEKSFQSKTVIVADCGENTGKVTDALNAKGIKPGPGYGIYQRNHLRFANFPTHSKEQFELLVDTLEAVE